MSVTIKHLKFEPPHLPTTVSLVLSDGESEEESEVWITARFPLGKRDADRLPLLLREALDQLQRLIDEGMANAAG